MKRHFTDSRKYLTDLILRLSLAFAFIYSALLGYLHPFDWIGYFPSILRDHLATAVILNLFGLTEILIGLWFIWGRKLFIPSVIASVYLLSSILFNFGQFDIFFRNVSILGIAVVMSILSYPRFISKSKLVE